jgi:hypothetical protein
MSLYDRVLEDTGTGPHDATHSKDGAFRTDMAWVAMPLGRKPKKGEFINPEQFNESIRLVERVEPAVEHLYVFDMDDTLIQQSMRPADWPHKRWWTRPESLKPPFPVKIKAPQKAAFSKAKGDPVGKVVVMTGRIATKEMKSTVTKLLTRLGFGPLKFNDNLFLKKISVRDTAAWKKSMLTGFTKRFPNLKEISMWEDRGDHASAFRKHILSLGLKANVTHVKGGQPFAFAEGYDGRSGPRYPALKKGKCRLDPEERQLCLDREAVWHFNMGPGGVRKPSPAVWKSKVNGKTWYVTNTHRAYNVTPTLKGTIKRFHDFIKGTA